ncbi:MAG: 2-polyprenylphenol 6-hydroxylase [Proteobacteria bacterium]|nr:2-polyprenylphenol 6-hydroxylase [Pseudomonadota bacterium]MBI3499000.1 2-polyprenylphenol 6-hydroxylase [Pseudomonadota bacterium]
MLRALRHALRLVSIARTLARHDALFVLELVPVAPALTALAGLMRREASGRPGERLAAALTDLGPSFIKLGQLLATRADLIGEEMAADLSLLQDRLAPFPGIEAGKTVESELGKPIGELFQSFEAAAVAAASIAQVHLAVTCAGKPVAVKVLRPGIEAAFRRDTELFRWVAERIEASLPALRRLRPQAVVETFTETVRVEMDLRLEAAAASELAENFAGDPDFRVPKVDWERTARRVLTLERVEGIRIDDVPALIAAGQDIDAVLAKSAAAFFRQVFRDGFFHADMHPGNMFVAADGSLAPVDFGIMGRLDVATRRYLADMLIGFLARDYRRVAEVHFQAGYVPAHKSVDAFMQACRSIGEPVLGKPLNEISVGRLLAQLFQVTETFEMETQPQLLLLQKTMVVSEGVGRTLNPRVNMWQLAQPLIEAWVREHRGPEARIGEAMGSVALTIERLPSLVRDTERAVSAISGGVKLHPDTMQALAGALRAGQSGSWPLWLAILALALIVGIYFLR